MSICKKLLQVLTETTSAYLSKFSERLKKSNLDMVAKF